MVRRNRPGSRHSRSIRRKKTAETQFHLSRCTAPHGNPKKPSQKPGATPAALRSGVSFWAVNQDRRRISEEVKRMRLLPRTPRPFLHYCRLNLPRQSPWSRRERVAELRIDRGSECNRLLTAV